MQIANAVSHMKIEWHKVTWYSKIVALALFVALPFIGFYIGSRYGGAQEHIKVAEEGGLLPSSTVTASPPPLKTTGTKSGTPTSALTYSQAINLYGPRRIQFDDNCQAIPNSLNIRNKESVMFDNRSAQAKTITVEGRRYTLKGYGFQVVRLESAQLPHAVTVDCGSGRNNASILLQ